VVAGLAAGAVVLAVLELARPGWTPWLLAALLAAATVPAARAENAQTEAFRCQFQDGHVEFRDGTCPYGTKALNVNRPTLKQAATPSAASAPAPAPAPAA